MRKSRVFAARRARSLPPCGGGLGRGVLLVSAIAVPPSLSLPHKGGGNAVALSIASHFLFKERTHA